ncbi:hypothetical protein M422DRAFT_46574 [Sphaerobolus stellatus SS14]|uniref:Unplaced genomic scaffold SPHSTscaffold_36, whole genome shotgun sequence n=1 Tax=Sphaerobolus stellatus (strain SS14) TaxID=990650 RepID=A0A0C9URK2_SPHS4|nr:hypothetical protein M422DRAFT_46574 [Sphaerobolus stellatus SS14]
MNASPSTTPVHSPSASHHNVDPIPPSSATPRATPPLDTPADPADPADPDPDVDMSDATLHKPLLLSDADEPHVVDTTMQTPENNNNDASPSETSVATRPAPDDDDADIHPPAKRARRLSDPDQASLVHSAPNGNATNGVLHPQTPPAPAPVHTPQSSRPPSRPPSRQQSSRGPITLNAQQYKFCLSTIRQLKKSKDALPFLTPVDPIALGIPHYFTTIKHPMDLSTVEKKIQSSNPSKSDPNHANPRYRTADEFIQDVKLIFANCTLFNGADHLISQMGRRLEAQFDKSMKHLPPAGEPPKPVVKKEAPPPPPPVVVAPPPPPPPAPVPKKVVRRSSTSVPTIRRNETEASGRPKREIHPPPPKDLPYTDVPRKVRRDKKKDDGTLEQLKFCGKILADFTKKKQYWPVASPFVEPVDWRALNLPSYPKIIKRPMDLGTMRQKLERGEYPNASRFWDDFKLMIKNCFTFNPSDSAVYKAAEQLQQHFDEKWANLPPLREVSEDDDDSEDESETERQRAITAMENQLASLKNGIDAMKKPKKEKPKKEKYPGVPSSSKNGKPIQKSTKKKLGKMLPDEEVLSFEQKKDLSETIQTLEGPKLERVIQIIHEGVPEIRDNSSNRASNVRALQSTEEIELDIDSLPASVLTKLYNYVLRPLRPSKRRTNNPGGGTGGLKRKSMDEDVEAEKIRRLEAQLHRFDNGGAMPTTAFTREDESQSSDSSDEGGSSESDSD